MSRLTDEELLAAVDAAEATSLGPMTSEIAADRADALNRYLGKNYAGDDKLAAQGRSTVVSRDVSDVVEGVTANTVKPFVASDEVVMFTPRGPEDEDAARQETDYVNFVIQERNNGFVVLTSAIKDALLLRNGYVKCGWRVRQDVVSETYQGLSDDELALLTGDDDVEIVEHNEYPSMAAVMPGQAPSGPGAAPTEPAATLHDVKVRRVRPTEYVEICPAPPDEIRVSVRTTESCLQDSNFVQHRTHKSLSELREMGYKVADDISDDDDASTVEDFARQNFSNAADMWQDPTKDAARRLVLFKESWIRIDRDGDGIAELRRVCQVGRNLLADEEADIIPIAVFSSLIMPHRHLGVSVYDLVKDLAQIKTAVLRSYLDNRNLQNNSEKVINVDAVPNIADFLESRPGGVKRVQGDPNSVVMPLVVPDTGAGALQSLEYLDSIRENRTGYTKTAQGIDPDSLASDTAQGMAMQMTQSQLRLEMIARTIAETGMRDLVRIVHALTLKHSTRAEKAKLRGKWVTVNPREWVRRTDLSISVGLGHTAGPQMAQALIMLGQAQQQAMPLGIVKPDNIYNTVRRLPSALGFKAADGEFFTAPEKAPKMGPNGQPVIDPNTGQPVMEAQAPPPQPSPQEKVEQMRQQGDAQKTQFMAQHEAQMKQMDLGLEGQKIQMDAAAKEREQQNAMALQASNDQRDAMRAQQDHEFKLQQMAVDDKFKRDQMAAKFIFEAQQKELDRAAQMQMHREQLAVPQAQATSKQEQDGKAHARHSELMGMLQKPKKVTRMPDGSFVVQHVQ